MNTINLRLKRTPSQSSNGNFLAPPGFFADFKGIFASLTFVRLGKSNQISDNSPTRKPQNQLKLTMKTMKTIISVTSVLAALTLAMLPAKAQTTYLATGNFNGSGADGKEISSAVVNNDASTITFTINSGAQIQASWIFYAVDIQIIGQAGSGYTGLSNPIWAGSPTLGISTGENAVLNDNGGTFGAYTYSGGVWTQNAGGAVAAGGTGFNYVTMTVPLSSLGLSVGDSFYFDVASSYTAWNNGGPQSAYSALDSVSGYPAETDSSWQPWLGSNSYDSATDASGTTFGTAASMYTVTVPEPTTLALLSGGVILLLVQRRRG